MGNLLVWWPTFVSVCSVDDPLIFHAVLMTHLQWSCSVDDSVQLSVKSRRKLHVPGTWANFRGQNRLFTFSSPDLDKNVNDLSFLLTFFHFSLVSFLSSQNLLKTFLEISAKIEIVETLKWFLIVHGGTGDQAGLLQKRWWKLIMVCMLNVEIRVFWGL